MRRLLCNRRSRSHARPRIGFALTIAPSSTSYRPTISSACVQLWSVRPLFASSTFPRQKLTQLISNPVHPLSIQPCFGSLQWVPGPWILDHWASPPIWLSIGFHLLSMDSLSRKRSRHNICESGRSPLNGKVSMKASVVKKDLSTIFICGICTKLKFKGTLGELNFHEITNEQSEMVPL